MNPSLSIHGEQLIPMLERKRLLDSAWVVCLIAALGGVSALWFMRILNVDLARIAWLVFGYALSYLVASALTDRLPSPRALAWAMRSMMVASVVFLGVFWHLVGGLAYPMFLSAFAVPVMISGMMTVGLPGYVVACLSIFVAGTVAAAESPGLRWYLQQMHVPVPGFLPILVREPAARPLFAGHVADPSYEFALIATFSFMQIVLAFVSTPLTTLLWRINSRFETSKKLLGEAQGLFHAVLRAAPEPTVVIYADSGQIVQACDTFFQRMMIRPSQLVGKGLFEVVAFDDPESVNQALRARHGVLPFCVYRVGPEMRIANLSFHRTEHGGIAYQYVAWHELTDVYYLQAALNAIHEPLMVLDNGGSALYSNSAARELFGPVEMGTNCAALPGLKELLEETDDTAVVDCRDMRWMFQGTPYAVNRFKARLPGGGDGCSILWLHSLVREEALFNQATRDALTGIYNRRYFDEAMPAQVERTGRGHRLTLAYFDLDDFKGINDTLGHAAGDVALRTFVAAVQAELRETDVFARRGGDEFAVLFVDCGSDVAAAAVGRIRAHLSSRETMFENHLIRVKFSAGLADCRPNDSVETLLDRADRALYEVKHGGKGRVAVAR
jgi:diguanylate cyclase (GGDEF)-like protein